MPVNHELRAGILTILRDGPMTTREMADALGVSITRVWSTAQPLLVRGLVASTKPERSKEHVYRLTKAGRDTDPEDIPVALPTEPRRWPRRIRMSSF